MGLLVNNVGLSALLFAFNLVPDLPCLWVQVFMFAGRNTYLHHFMFDRFLVRSHVSAHPNYGECKHRR